MPLEEEYRSQGAGVQASPDSIGLTLAGGAPWQENAQGTVLKDRWVVASRLLVSVYSWQDSHFERARKIDSQQSGRGLARTQGGRPELETLFQTQKEMRKLDR